MFSTIATWGLVIGTASLVAMGGIFVTVMRRKSSGTQITGWQKKALHPAGYLKVAGIAYGVAGVSYLIHTIF